MDMNKGKILIYVLTFTAYAWTGYGSEILSNLKDAVLSAENVFGNVIEKIGDVLHSIKDINQKIDATIDEECIFSCPNGAKPKPNKYHKPASNGCGPEGMKIENADLPHEGMTKCCDEHDICYGTCNKDKDKCDLDFRKCLYRLCDKNPTTAKACKLAAKMLYTATTALGCSFYLDAQKQACFCQPKRNEL